jgi:hypothetical protein
MLFSKRTAPHAEIMPTIFSRTKEHDIAALALNYDQIVSFLNFPPQYLPAEFR